MSSPLLTPELLRELANVRFAPRNRVEGRHAGRHKSPLRGSSTEFRDYREYSQGDDPARVDWRVFARNDRHVIRTFEQESQTGCVLLLDRSASMDFGSPETKLRCAARLAACLAHIVVHSQDQTGLFLYTNDHHEWLPPAGNTRHLDNILRLLNSAKGDGSADLPEALHKLAGLLQRRCTLVLASDFYCDPAALFLALNPFVHRGMDVHLLHILDPQERQLPDAVMLAFEDLETGTRLRADPTALRARYQSALDDHVRALRELAIRRGVRHHMVFTDQPLFAALEGLTA